MTRISASNNTHSQVTGLSHAVTRAVIEAKRTAKPSPLLLPRRMLSSKDNVSIW